jgi:hypothetical protein
MKNVAQLWPLVLPQELWLTKENPDELVEISYVSKATKNFGLLSLMYLMDLSVKWNKSNNLTGVLFYENNYFSQIIEGKRQDVLAILERIQKDQRHQIIRQSEPVVLITRRYPNWSLRFYDGDKIAQMVPKLKNAIDGLPDTKIEVLEIMRSIAQADLN